MATFRKGDLVQLHEDRCRKVGSLRQQEAAAFPGRRPTTHEEQHAWYKTDAAKGMNDAGESKLPPQSAVVWLDYGRAYEVVRARCRVRLGYGNPVPGMISVRCTKTGEVGYLKREFVRPYGGV
tara:strand:+ start:1417 stop:1785 length:369 start_codon:yes stop_codon:yes gene_type:complete